ncbi:MAG: formate/nitrite transporter family protein [Solirubrobacterales bacterium]
MTGGRPVRQVWVDGVEEGERRLTRSTVGMVATGTVAGIDIMIGALAQMTMLGAMTEVLPPLPAKMIAAFMLGIAFMFITVGRSELFTENFLIPVAPVLAGRERWTRVAKLWAITGVMNLVAMIVLTLLFVIPGVLDPQTLAAVGEVADKYAGRSIPASIASAIIAGAVITVFTWGLAAAETASVRLVMALLLGFVLAAPTLNHAIVGFGESFWGVMAGTAVEATHAKVLLNLGIAIVFNTVGGMLFVTLTRLYQVIGEEEDGGSLTEIVDNTQAANAAEADTQTAGSPERRT